LILSLPFIGSQLIYDFNISSDVREWSIVDDVVMGGKSNGNFEISSDGHGVFSGFVNTENNGGFSSIRYQFDEIKSTANSKVVLTIKGDGKEYQFRIKDKIKSYYSFITTFQTSGEWQKIVIPLKDLYPSFRGRTLDLPNYSSESFEEIVFLIGNKKKESFRLIIDKIEIE